MSSTLDKNRCDQADLVCAYAMQALPSREAAAVEAHISACAQCQRELETLRPVIDSFVSWPTDVLRPAASLQERGVLRLAWGYIKPWCCSPWTQTLGSGLR